jgi:hypothetical protein
MMKPRYLAAIIAIAAVVVALNPTPAHHRHRARAGPIPSLQVAQFSTSSPVPQSHVSVTPIPNDLATVPAAVKAEAATVHSEGDLARVSPAARHYLTTPVQNVTLAQITPQASSPKAGDVQLVSYLSSVPYPACWTVDATDTYYNSVGWVMYTLRVRIGNWCWVWNLYGYPVIYSQPYWAYYTSTHWGWSPCGIDAQLAGWVQDAWEYGAAVDEMFGNPTCWFPFEQHMLTGVWAYGDGSFQYT